MLGQLLLKEGRISSQQLSTALLEQQSTRERLGEILTRGGTDPEIIARALAEQLRLPYAAAPLLPHRDVLKLVDRNTAMRLRIVPLATHEKALRIAMSDPLDIVAIDDLQFKTGRRVEPVVASPRSVEQALAAYDTTEVATLIARIPTVTSSAHNDDELRRASEAPPVVALLDHLLVRAAAARASDIHVEPGPERLCVRIRVDGVMRELLTLPVSIAPSLTSRIKVIANLDISIRRKPQDGRCSFVSNTTEYAARVSTLPTQFGEKIVLRLLASTTAPTTLPDLGMSVSMLQQFRGMLKRHHGVILVTGPTGSGKSSTLYAALGELDARARNIVTLEDPIERRMEGITQVQVNRRGGTSFAQALRAVLRQDPDIILIGELRDRETVETAFAAALTGHLVLATLHTNDTATAATRLIEMGAPPYLICGALVGVLAQRLVRRLCPKCRGKANDGSNQFVAMGCVTCDHVGYRGRVGIFELAGMSMEWRDLIMKRAPADAFRIAGKNAKVTFLADDAFQKATAGDTSYAEVDSLLLMDRVQVIAG